MTVRNPDDETQVVDSVLLEAHRLINGDRQRDYGPPWVDYERTVGAFNAFTGRDLTIREGILFMECVKLSRRVESPHVRDHYVDGPGYAGCAWMTEQAGRGGWIPGQTIEEEP